MKKWLRVLKIVLFMWGALKVGSIGSMVIDGLRLHMRIFFDF